MALATKSVWSPIAKGDGLRILATRFRGRGLSTDRYDVWMANLGPSEALLRGFLAGDITWATFARRYRAELFAGGTADAANRTIKNHGQKFTLRLIKSSPSASRSPCSATAPRIRSSVIATSCARLILSAKV